MPARRAAPGVPPTRTGGLRPGCREAAHAPGQAGSRGSPVAVWPCTTHEKHDGGRSRPAGGRLAVRERGLARTAHRRRRRRGKLWPLVVVGNDRWRANGGERQQRYAGRPVGYGPVAPAPTAGLSPLAGPTLQQTDRRRLVRGARAPDLAAARSDDAPLLAGSFRLPVWRRRALEPVECWGPPPRLARPASPCC